MGDAMKRSLRVLGAATLMSCLPCASFAMGPTTPSTPPSMSAISYKMGGVAGDLAKKETGEPVQNQEKRIVARSRPVDRGAREGMRKLQRQQGAEQSEKAGARLDDPRRHGRHRRPGRPRGSAKDWAKLSARERDRILQSMSEGFPPEYRTVLERYYRRLAEEKTAAVRRDASAAQGSANATAA